MKKVVFASLAVLAVLVFTFGIVMGSTFGGLKKSQDQLELPGGAKAILDGYVSLFFLTTSNQNVVLIDAGNDTAGTAILAELGRRGLKPEAVKAIFLTHGHPDHTAAVALFPSAEVWAFQADQGLAEGTHSSLGPLPRMMGPASGRKVRVTRLLKDGEPVEVDGLLIKPYLLPGHTAGSAAFLSNGILFLGDTATIQSDEKLRNAPWVFSDDTEENAQSLRTLAKRLTAEHAEVSVLAPSHSGAALSRQALDGF